MAFIFIFYVFILVEECTLSSCKIESFCTADTSSSLFRIIGSFVPSQKAVMATFRFTPNFCTSAVKEIADNISFWLLISQSVYSGRVLSFILFVSRFILRRFQ
jgi:hypothetical protein